MLEAEQMGDGGGVMRDDPISKMIREKKGLPENWRAYLYEARPNTDIRITGSLVRPITEYERPDPRGFMWIAPAEMKRTMTIPRGQYDLMLKARDKPACPTDLARMIKQADGE